MKTKLRMIAAILITISVALTAAACAPSGALSVDSTGETDAKASRQIEAVRILINDREYENAIARVDAALREHGSNETLQLQRGLILVQMNRLDDAGAHYRSLIKRFDKNPEPGNNLAMVYRLQGQYEKSIALFRSIIDKFPDYAQAYENLGDTYIALASRKYANALDITPDSEILESKLDTASGFEEVASSNTAVARRARLAEKQQAEQAIAEIAAIRKAEDDAARRTVEDPTDRILGTLQSWANAWSSRDVDLYIAHYSRDFKPEDGLSLDEWLAQRRNIILGADYIDIDIDEIKLARIAANRTIVTFEQRYESNLLKVGTLKSLTLQRYDDNKWLIVREETRPLQAI